MTDIWQPKWVFSLMGISFVNSISLELGIRKMRSKVRAHAREIWDTR